MGFRPQNMTRSERLAEIVRRCERADDRDGLSDACDMTSTAGYDNDGSIGPELLDNGIGLGMAALRYDANATVFFAFGEDRDTWVTCYYQYGKDEDDAIRRLCDAMGWSFPTQDPEVPQDEGDEGDDYANRPDLWEHPGELSQGVANESQPPRRDRWTRFTPPFANSLLIVTSPQNSTTQAQVNAT